MTTLTLYSKPDCSLCDELLEVVERVRRELDFDFKKVDISQAPDLLERFGQSVPAIAIDGEVRFEHAVSERRLRDALEQSASTANTNGTVGATR